MAFHTEKVIIFPTEEVIILPLSGPPPLPRHRWLYGQGPSGVHDWSHAERNRSTGCGRSCTGLRQERLQRATTTTAATTRRRKVLDSWTKKKGSWQKMKEEDETEHFYESLSTTWCRWKRFSLFCTVPGVYWESSLLVTQWWQQFWQTWKRY